MAIGRLPGHGKLPPDMEPDQPLTAPAEQYFSADYATARKRFLSAAEAAGETCSLCLDAAGPEGSPLTIDIACLGSPAPERALLHTSGMHGVEGFAGSAIQLALLQRPLSLPPDGAVVLVHGLNPYGMAWLRRVNENNVDLNRNFLTAGERYEGAPTGYRRETQVSPAQPAVARSARRATRAAARSRRPARAGPPARGSWFNLLKWPTW